MAKPTDIPTWATGPGETIVDPGVTRTQTGFVAGKKAPAGWFNFLFNRMGGWFSCLDNLHDEPDFLNKTYAWTGPHAHLDSVGFYDTVVVCGTANEFLYADALGVVTARTRKTRLSLSSFQTDHTILGGLPGWAYFDGRWFKTAQNDVYLRGEAPLPTGATLVGAEAGLTVESGSATVTLNAGFNDATTADVSATTSWSGSRTSTGIITATLGSPQVINGQDQLATITIAATGSAVAYINWVKLLWLDPGPRNY